MRKIFWWLFKCGRAQVKIGNRRVPAEISFRPKLFGGMVFMVTPHSGELMTRNRNNGSGPHTLAGINDMVTEEIKGIFKAVSPLWPWITIERVNGLGKECTAFLVRWVRPY